MAKETTCKPPTTEENNVYSMFNGEMNIKTEVKIEKVEWEYDTSELFLEQKLFSVLWQNNNETYNKFELYADHIIKDDLVIGPELIQENPIHKDETTETKGINLNKDKLYECKECNANFLNKLDLSKHRKVAHTPTIKCEYCGMSFTLKPNMLRHQKNVCKLNMEKESNQTPTRYKCNECDKIYADRQSIVHHLKMVHMPLRNSHAKGACKLSCEFCNRIYSSLQNLNRHVIYVCKENKHRKKQFTNPLICDYCKKGFTHKQSLIVHMRQHVGGVVKYSCHFCKKQYTKKHNLTCHINKTHLNLMLYACKHCSSKFSWRHSLACHEKKYHYSK